MSIIGLIARRILQAIPTLLIVGTIVFLTMRVIPGDPAIAVLGEHASEEQLDAFRTANGLNEPVIAQYFTWLAGLIRGDLGVSYVRGEAVSTLVASQLSPTLLNASLALTITLVIGIPVGIYSATRAGSVVDKVTVGAAAVIGTIPSFLVALILVAVFAVTLRVLPSGGYAQPGSDSATAFTFMILPALALGITQVGYIVRMVRSSVLDEVTLSYVDAQRARGYRSGRAVGRAFRNALVPLLTVFGQTFGLMIVGSVIIETVFTIPGLGQLVINAVSRADFSLLAGVVIFMAVLVITINLIVDVVSSLLDPRVRSGQ